MDERVTAHKEKILREKKNTQNANEWNSKWRVCSSADEWAKNETYMQT